MKIEEVKGSWEEQKSKLKARFAVLVDKDLLFEEGKMDGMLGKLQLKLGKTQKELRKIIAGL